MKVRIELDPSMDEPEILIRAPRLTQELAQLQESILKQKLVPLAFYKNRSEYFLDLADILFFETDGEKIYGHTKDEAYEVKQKLYELEELLPIAFCRISKSTIVNAKQIYSLEKSFFRDQYGEFLSDPQAGPCIKTLLSSFKRTTKRNEVR